VEDHFLNLEVQVRAAADLRDRVRQQVFVLSLRVATARAYFLRVAERVGVNPRGRLDQFEMGTGIGREFFILSPSTNLNAFEA
jgi:hypothetical protein